MSTPHGDTSSQTQHSPPQSQADQQPSTSGQHEGTQEEAAKGECPICTLMREGGCEQQFHSFMDCGVDAEKGQREYTDCIKAFESMRACMESNPTVFAPLLTPLEESTNSMDKSEGTAQKESKAPS
ncbi:hypothetical protein DUNSADRAFT_2704 [Dunaliella salina]|uniref:GCK domain-containing protein n=1 Tax=Dunaliella salina TaxID=3046 RepID=A0ABQ7H8A8_DUNSA|nr:hypothetical protein DUNSADRAFT_2704 [Dunaliella salina]|eukprot:KAF5843091.1 hypothetical protein DUNSADRAFT_2704 [Dunaliella salina]